MNDTVFRCELPGGTRVVGERVPGRRSVALGVWLRVGSRDEVLGREGIAHFIEHLVFKGTRNRNGSEIASSLECVGGSLDAFTTKDTTCFYARVLEEHLDLAADVLTDVVVQPLFREEDVEVERQVILEELRSAEDAPEDLIGDLAMYHLWPEDIMGASILGTRTSLAGLNAATVREFHRQQYTLPRTVISAAGAVDVDRIQDLFGQKLELPADSGPRHRSRPAEASPTLAVHQSDLGQLYMVLLGPGPSERDPRRRAAHLLAEIFGGGMSSRLFQTIREEAGLAYSVYAYTENYDDVGMFATGLSVSPKRGTEALERTLDEIRRLLRGGLEPGELEGAKAQVRGSLVMGLESLTNRMNHLARNELRLGALESVEEAIAGYEAVTTTDLMELAADVLAPERLSLVALGPARSDSLRFKPFDRVIDAEIS